jgi:hypothetical protein
VYILNYKELVEKVTEHEEEYEITNCIYFKALERLKEVQKDVSSLDDIQHMRRVIKLFLTNWGNMNRVVNRDNLKWKELAETIRHLKKEFDELRKHRFISTDFNEKVVTDAIKKIYESIKKYPYLGGQTCMSKILHLLNPEIFVMWDDKIRKNYKKINNRIRDTPEGYLEFLKETRREIMEALHEYKDDTGKGLNELEKELRKDHGNRTLARIIDEYNWSIAHKN